MARNIEIKARVDDPAALLDRARAIADSGPVLILQDDTFFHCPSGRLKLRTLSENDGQLIHYRRADACGPKESRYSIVPTSAPGLLRDVLAQAFGIRGRVRKRRLLFITGNTRIHLDDVEGLGAFVELEVVLDDGADAAQGIAVARGLMERLAIRDANLVDRAYVDLLSDRTAPPDR